MPTTTTKIFCIKNILHQYLRIVEIVKAQTCIYVPTNAPARLMAFTADLCERDVVGMGWSPRHDP